MYFGLVGFADWRRALRCRRAVTWSVVRVVSQATALTSKAA
jgi:hypothetical protein